MHIGLVIDGDLGQTSGGYRYDRELVSHLERRGDEVEIVSLPQDRDRLDRPFDVLLQDELCHPALVDRNPSLDEPNSIVALVHLLRCGDPETDTDTGADRVRERERRYLESVDAAICTSEFTRDRVGELVSNDALPTHVAPPAGRREDAARAAGDVQTRAQTGPLRIAFVGNVVPRKNLDTLVDALARVDREWDLTVVGSRDADPEYTRTVENRVTAHDLDDRISFRGRVSDDTLESILDRAHVLAVPSRYEGFGMVYLEAMEFGVVPIASSVGGASELVADGRNGVVVDPDDGARLASLVGALAADRDRLSSLAVGALETAAAHPTWSETLAGAREFVAELAALAEHAEHERGSARSNDNDGDRP